jgi:hypothetical protein
VKAVVFTVLLMLPWGAAHVGARAAVSAVDPESQDGRSLRVELQVRLIAGAPYIRWTVWNTSQDMLCVSQEELSALAGGILLTSVEGHPTNRPLGGREGPVSTDLGVALNEPYYFIRPASSLSAFVDTDRLGLVPGAYSYSIAVRYYRCAEIIDLQRMKLERQVHERMFRAQGQLVWPVSGIVQMQSHLDHVS